MTSQRTQSPNNLQRNVGNLTFPNFESDANDATDKGLLSKYANSSYQKNKQSNQKMGGRPE